MSRQPRLRTSTRKSQRELEELNEKMERLIVLASAAQRVETLRVEPKVEARPAREPHAERV